MKRYFLIVATVVVCLALFGFVLPMLFSARSTEAVLLGGLIVVIMPVLGAGILKMLKGESK